MRSEGRKKCERRIESNYNDLGFRVHVESVKLQSVVNTVLKENQNSCILSDKIAYFEHWARVKPQVDLFISNIGDRQSRHKKACVVMNDSWTNPTGSEPEKSRKRAHVNREDVLMQPLNLKAFQGFKTAIDNAINARIYM